MDQIAHAKRIVRDHTVMFDAALKQGQFSNRWDAISSDFHWRSMHPFYEKKGIEAVVSEFWGPLSQSLRHLHRREDVFFAGENDVDGGSSVWTCSMGHFVGLFDADWHAIPKTGRIAHLRYAEFMKVEEGRIVESALFFDLIGLMHEAGVYPLPPMTGSYFIYPGPATHDGLLLAPQNESAGQETLALINQMIEDLSGINHLTDEKCPPELLARTWREDMVWYGPCGIGASYTIERYQKQHQYPFRMNLDDKTYHGHIARFAEGNYGGFFGWANLSNRNMGGFLGLPEAATSSEMRVVDVYRRDGNKLAENWVIIDIPYYLKQQGLDVLTRLQEVRS